MARSHSVCISVDPGDKVRTFSNTDGYGYTWINIGDAVDIFLPSNATHAIQFLTALTDACDDLRLKIEAFVTPRGM